MTLERIGAPVRLKDGTEVPLVPAVAVGKTLYISGQLGFDSSGSLVAGIEEQTRACLRNLTAVLESAGSSVDQLAKLTVWLVNKEDFALFNRVYTDFFQGVYPARSTVCSELMVPGALIEIDAIAALP